MKSSPLVLLIIVFFLLTSCKKETADKPLPPQPITVFEVKTETVPIYKDFVGQVFGDKDIPIRARVEGFLEKIYFKEGSKVKKGQLLYSIDSDRFKEAVAAQQSMVSQAQTLLVQTESDYNRVKPLAEMDAISKRELDISQANKDAALSSLEAAKANLNIAQINLGYAEMYAPIDGVIGKTLAREGEFVGKLPNPVILNTVSKIDVVRVQFFLSENEYLRFMERVLNSDELEKMKKQENLELILSDDSIHKYRGHVDFIDRNVEPTTGTIMIQASFPNPEGLIRPGQYSKVRALIATKEDAIIIPQQTVREVQGANFVYIVNSDNLIENRGIEILKPYKDYFILKSGVAPGEKIVLENVQKLRSKMEVIPTVVAYQSKGENNTN
ncbi:MAG: efflux RND transporter periplasmic adaptor subunit [Flavobacteriaceae bacterium]|nr:efflux RND transporter periplasmic adaptor subunit [Flavobacteriaceae bacterium]